MSSSTRTDAKRGGSGRSAPLDREIATALEGDAGDFAAILANLSDATLLNARDALAQIPLPELSDKVERTDYELPGREGVRVRVHRPHRATDPLPGLYWMHGGGLLAGDYSADDLRFDRWCVELDLIGVCVDYRLAPEHPYPTPLEDCYAGLEWTAANAAEIGIDRGCLGIGGSSAGGGLAACVALAARDRHGPSISYQTLIYPMLDDRRDTVSSSWEDPLWSPTASEFAWRAYLGGTAGTDAVEPYAAAARADNLSDLPPTLVSIGALDGFSDESVTYANRLRHAGVPVELHVYTGAPHGFEALVPDAQISRTMTHDLLDWLNRQIS